MATTDISAVPFALIASSTTSAYLTLDPDRAYTIAHTGVDVANAAKTDTIVFQDDPTGVVNVTADMAAATSKVPLIDGNEPITIGPGITTLAFEALANAPCFTIIPSTPFFRNW